MKQTLSRYELNATRGMQQLIIAYDTEQCYAEKGDYLVTMRNSSADYTVHASVTNDAEWADITYDRECDVADMCAENPINNGDIYVVSFAKCLGFNVFEMIAVYTVTVD